jgi:outer membrane lipoprotein-sorting protein
MKAAMLAIAGLLSVLMGQSVKQPGPPPDAKPAAQPQSKPTAPDSELTARLEAIDAKAALVKDLTADFEQKKHTSLLKEPMGSSGRVRLRGSVVRWDTAAPRPSVIRIDEHEIRVYYPEDKTVEIYPVDEQLRRLTASPLPRLASIREQFQIRAMPATDIEGGAEGPDAVALRLTPKAESLRQHVQEVRVLLDASSGLVSRLEMIDADGDRTAIAFLRPRINTGLQERDVDLSVPAGTKESRPLEGLGGGPPPSGGGKK